MTMPARKHLSACILCWGTLFSSLRRFHVGQGVVIHDSSNLKQIFSSGVSSSTRLVEVLAGEINGNFLHTRVVATSILFATYCRVVEVGFCGGGKVVEAIQVRLAFSV